MTPKAEGIRQRKMRIRASTTPVGAGRSTFDLLDSRKLLGALHLGEGEFLVDLGCGEGNYALAAAPFLGQGGHVLGLDLFGESIERLRRKAAERNLGNVRALVRDVTRRLPLRRGSADIVLIATFLHDLVEMGRADRTLREVRRVLKPGGRLAIVEFRKREGPPGPPIEVRMSSREVSRLVTSFGFRPVRTLGLGLFHYLALFCLPDHPMLLR
jgi:ubiquinone/menaquinone biosynthesis C-methylase UbiE